MTIERTNEEVIIRLPASVYTDDLQRLVDYLVYKEATGHSEAAQADVDALSKEAKQGWWAKNKSRLVQ